MVTVASDVTVPNALSLTPMSPLPINSSTTDIGGAVGPGPPLACCGAVPCRVHQTIPPTSSATTIVVVNPERQPDRGLAGERSIEGASIGGLSGLSIPLSHEGWSGYNLRPGVYLFRDPQDIPNHDILNGPVAVCR